MLYIQFHTAHQMNTKYDIVWSVILSNANLFDEFSFCLQTTNQITKSTKKLFLFKKKKKQRDREKEK